MKDFQLLRQQVIKILRQNKKRLQKRKHIFFLYGIPLLLLSILTSIHILNGFIAAQIEEIRLFPSPIATTEQHRYPLLKTILGSKEKEENSPVLTADAAVVMEDASKVIVYAKNENLRFSMASTTKIMTALTALQHYGLNDILTIYTDTVEGAGIGFKKGEQLTFKNLLYAMMLPSANDAAVAIAQNYPGGEKAFIAKMNENASRYHLFFTNYTDSSGLEDSGDYTTVVDLARLASIAMKNKLLMEVVGTKQKVIKNTQEHEYEIYNLNKLLGKDGVIGMKTGFTDEAKGVLVTSKLAGIHLLLWLCIVMIVLKIRANWCLLLIIT